MEEIKRMGLKGIKFHPTQDLIIISNDYDFIVTSGEVK